MNKKLMALAVAGALTAPAAALAQVQIGGGITLLYFSHDPDNASSAQRSDVMQSSESEIRINGSEKLGGGLEVWFQCATSIDDIIAGNTGTQAGWCSRNSAIGFRGDFGNVFFGNWDTPLKLVQNRARGWFSGTNALVGGGYTLLAGSSSSGNGNGGAGNGSFYRRQANTTNYHSPNWGGFSLAAAISAANETVALSEGSPLNPRLLGLNAMFSTGPFWAGLGYEKHDDYNPASQAVATYGGGSDDNITVAAGYTFAGVLNLRLTYSQSTYETTAAGGESEVKGFGVYVDWNISGPHALHAAFITVDDVEGTGPAVNGYRAPGAGTGADVMTVAYGYNFSKRTEIYVAYNQMKNDTAASFSQGVVAVTLGGKQTTIGLGLKHSF